MISVKISAKIWGLLLEYTYSQTFGPKEGRRHKRKLCVSCDRQLGTPINFLNLLGLRCLLHSHPSQRGCNQRTKSKEYLLIKFVETGPTRRIQGLHNTMADIPVLQRDRQHCLSRRFCLNTNSRIMVRIALHIGCILSPKPPEYASRDAFPGWHPKYDVPQLFLCSADKQTVGCRIRQTNRACAALHHLSRGR